MGSLPAGARRRGPAPSAAAMVRALALDIGTASSRVDVLDRVCRLLEVQGVHAVILREERGELTAVAHRLPAAVLNPAQARLGRPLVDIRLDPGAIPFAAAFAADGVASWVQRPGRPGPARGAPDVGLGAALGWAGQPLAVVGSRTSPGRRGIIVAWGPGAGRWLLPVLEASGALMQFAWRVDARSSLALTSPSTGDGPAPAPGPPGPRASPAHDWDDLEAVLRPVVRLADRVAAGFHLLFPAPTGASLVSLGEVVGAGCDAARWRAELRRVSEARPPSSQLVVELEAAQLLGPRSLLPALIEDLGSPAPASLAVLLRLGTASEGAIEAAADALRVAGVTVGVAGISSSNPDLERMARLRPDFVELESSVTRELTCNATRRAVLGAILALGARLAVRVVAEGVDDETTAITLLWLGVLQGSGEALGRPFLVGPGRPRAGVQRVSVGELGAVAAARPITDALPGGAPPGLARGAIAPPSWASEADSGEAGGGRDGELRTVPVDLAQTLSGAALALQGEHDPGRILSVIADQLLALVPADTLIIYAAHLEERRFRAVLARGEAAEAFADHSFGLDQGLTGWVFSLGRPLRVGNADAHPASLQMPGTPVGDESMLLVPLIAGDHRLGMMNCTRNGLDRFTDQDRETASLLGHMAAAAWRNAQLYAELTEFAVTDALTGCFNTRWLRDAGPRDLAMAARDRRPLTVVLLDLDRFKRVNDSVGHAEGDRVLQKVGAALRSVVRAGDAAVRYGGEEFVLVLPGADAAGARRVLQAMRAELAAIPLPPACAIRRIAASVGVAVHPKDGETVDSLLEAADRAMYAAKGAGGDRVVLAGSTPQPPAPRLQLLGSGGPVG